MIFILNREGTVTETVTSPVYQGSNANEVVVLAPFAPTNTVTVGFTLPNGLIVQPKLTDSGKGATMTSLPVKDLSLKVGETYEDMSTWYCKLDRDITRYSGTLTMQFFLYDAAGDILASSSTTVPVQKGVPVLDGTTFDASTAAQLQKALDGVYAMISSLNEELRTVKETTEQNGEMISVLQNDVSQNTTAITSLGTRMTNAEGNIKDLKSSVSLIWTILGNTIINLTTVEDAYNTRVTAGGLSVVDEAPTTVHKITGASAASINLATVKDQTIVSNGVTFIGSATDGTVQMTGSVTEENEYATATVTTGFYLPVGTYTLYAPHKADKVGWHVRNAQSTSIAELNWNGTTTAVSFTVSAAGSYHLYVFIPRSAGTLDYTETPMLLRSDRTASLPAFEPYYAGIKSAGFMGIASTGINLVDFSDAPEGKLVTATGSIDTTNRYWFTPVAYFPCVAGQEYRHTTEHRNTMFKTAVAAFYDEAKTFISAQQISGNSPCLSVVAPRGAQYMRWSISKAGNPAVKPTQPMVYIRRMDTIPAYAPYVGDTTFSLASPITIGKWDSLDVDDLKKITGTALMTFDGTEDWNTEVTQSGDYRLQLQVTGFTVPASANDEPDLVCNLYPPKNANRTYTGMTGISLQDTRLQIYDPSYNAADSVADWKTYLAGLAAKGDPLTIAYHRATLTEMPLSLPKTYRAWNDGQETITGNPSGLSLTVNQDYYEEVSKA